MVAASGSLDKENGGQKVLVALAVQAVQAVPVVPAVPERLDLVVPSVLAYLGCLVDREVLVVHHCLKVLEVLHHLLVLDSLLVLAVQRVPEVLLIRRFLVHLEVLVAQGDLVDLMAHNGDDGQMV